MQGDTAGLRNIDGMVINNKYKLITKIDSGLSGSVYEAVDLSGQTKVPIVVKIQSMTISSLQEVAIMT